MSRIQQEDRRKENPRHEQEHLPSASSAIEMTRDGAPKKKGERPLRSSAQPPGRSAKTGEREISEVRERRGH